MDLRAGSKSLEKASKQQFNAFKGNPLEKPPSQRIQKHDFHKYNSRSSQDKYSFDAAWKGSVKNLMSSENLTEDLIKESVKELEKAMNESKRMLLDRDEEISKLRMQLEQAQNANYEQLGQDDDVLTQLEESQKRVLDLERQIQILREQHLEEIRTKDLIINNATYPQSNPTQEQSGNFPECTCYCGSVCKALRDLTETKRRLETTQKKYETLRNKVKEFRKQAEMNHRNAVRLPQADKSSCCMQ